MANVASDVLSYVNTSVAVMREQPNDDSEVVSQAYYSEPVKVIQEGDGWIKIETCVDNYQGWVKEGGIYQRKDPFLSDASDIVAIVSRCFVHIYKIPDTIYGPLMTLPFESRMQVVAQESPQSRWIKVVLQDGREAFVQRGDVKLESQLLDREGMCCLSYQFLGLPYTWGGRSSFGYDCSGFVQMLYRQMGVFLPRDTKDQIRWEGFNPTSIEKLMPGDLIFFGLDPEKIRHVGMSIGESRFIHADVAQNQPYIRISEVTESEWNGSGKFKYIAARALRV